MQSIKHYNFRSIICFICILTLLLCLMLWDMKKIQQLSIIIHDDHSSLWKKMNESLLNSWYNPYDLCILNHNNNNNITEINIINKKCVKLSNKKIKTNNNIECNIGSAIKDYNCYMNITSRSYYKSIINDPMLGNPYNMLLDTSIYDLSISNKAIVFIGDGITKQSQDAMICELLRIDKNIKYNSVSSLYSTNYTLKWIKSKRKLDIYYFRLVHINEHPNTNIQRRRKLIVHGYLQNNITNKIKLSTIKTSKDTIKTSKDTIKTSKDTIKTSKDTISTSIDTVSSSKDTVSTSKDTVSSSKDTISTSKDTNNIETNVPIAIETSTSTRFPFIKKQMKELVLKYKSMILIVNIGVYYNSRVHFRDDLPLLVDWMVELHNKYNCTILFRESAAQHWSHSTTGYFEYDIDGKNNSMNACKPVMDSTPDFDWRNRDVFNHINNAGYQHIIHVIPFRDLTLPLYNMHPSNGTHYDCTHYCYFPQMWQTIWYYIFQHRF